MAIVMTVTAVLTPAGAALASGQCSDIFGGLSLVEVAPARVATTLPAALRADVGAPDEFSLANEAKFQSAIQGVADLTKREKRIARWARWSGQTRRASDIAADRRLQLLEFYLTTGEISEGVDLYRQLFRSVELDIFLMRRLSRKLNVVADPAEQARIREEQVSLLENFGRNYGEYKAVRAYLERPRELGPKATTAEKIYRYLGVHNLTDLFPELQIPEVRVAIDDIKALFRGRDNEVVDFKNETRLEKDIRLRTVAAFANLDRDGTEEAWAAIRAFRHAMVSGAQSLVHRLPEPVRDPVSKLLGMDYERYLRDERFPQVMRILGIQNNVKAQLELLVELNAAPESGRILKREPDELLRVFARIYSGQDEWIAIRNHAKANIDSPIDQAMYARMVKAEGYAAERENLSFYYVPSLSETLAKIFIVALTGVAGVCALPSVECFGSSAAPAQAPTK